MKTITECRSCGKANLTEFLDLGEQYLSDFRADRSRPPKCPLVAVFCEDCKLVQLRHTTPSADMYHENYGFKSGVSDSIKNDLRDVVSTALEYHDSPMSWLDIASNDGYLLSCVPDSIYRVGVDPIKKYCEEAKQHADLIINDFFDLDRVYNCKYNLFGFDIVTSISCFYDMDDPNKFVADVEEVMARNGIWVIQQNYLLPTLQLKAVDNFCAEHLEYYTLLSLEPLLERHGLEVIDLSTSMVNGGSLRTIVAKAGRYPVQPVVEQQRAIEAYFKLNELTPYVEFAETVMTGLQDLKTLVDGINAAGQKVYILAASTRGSTIWQSAGITEKDVSYAVERNENKVGKYFSALGIQIISEIQARKEKPEYLLVGPWFFVFPEILNREKQYILDGGTLIVPLPELLVINRENLSKYENYTLN